jgi:hypothetical protein
VQVRMLQKGVIKAIVPWDNARRVFAVRLRRRLAESAVLGHIAAADPSVGSTAALAMLQSWVCASSQSCEQGGGKTGNCADVGTVEGSNATIGTVRDGIDHLQLMKFDEEFLAWLHSARGAAKIGAELKKLKRTAAATLVLEVARSEEGREGLLQAVQTMLQKSASLRAQLSAAIREADSAANGRK